MSNRLLFTKTAIAALPDPPKGQRSTYYDEKVQKLAIRLTAAGSRTFYVIKRTESGMAWLKLGLFPDLNVENARKEAEKVLGQFAQGNDPAQVRRAERAEMTLDDLHNEYMTRCAAFNRRPDKPKANYRLYLSAWGKRKLSTIKHEEVDRLHKKIGRENGVVTANIALKLLHVMFNKAINEWRIWSGENPAHGIKKFPEQSRDRFLQSDELPRFFQAVAEEQNETIRDYVLISLLTGARRTNVLEMRWQDVSFERAEWRIGMTKNGTPQTVTLSPEALEVLRNRKPEEEAVFVFPGTGKQGHLAEPKKGWTRILERAGIADLRIHDLRRTLGSWQAKTGASMAIIGKSLNHKSQSTTAIYARLDLDPVRQSVNTATSAMMAAAGVKQTAEVLPIKQTG
ncbi:MAG: site-specific integrase [Sulfurimicrobium sp.]|nr:site-specific integrase [Sulfurimicrobium sp.]